MRRVTLRAENADPVAAVARGLGLDHVGTIWAVIILHGGPAASFRSTAFSSIIAAC
jgi:hypothetical protein